MTALAYNGETVTDEANQLLNLTEAHLDIGMRGVPVGTCRTSFVTPNEGVHYCGYPIAELAEMEPEDVVYLLHNKELPTHEQSSAFKKDLAQRATIPGDFNPIFSALPRDGHPMDWLAIGIQSLGMWDCKNDWREDALNLVARMPRMMGLLFRYREGRTDDIPADDTSLSMVERFTHTLQLDVDQEKLARVLSVYLVLHMDHGGGNLSTFVGKAVASGHATLYLSLIHI